MWDSTIERQTAVTRLTSRRKPGGKTRPKKTETKWDKAETSRNKAEAGNNRKEDARLPKIEPLQCFTRAHTKSNRFIIGPNVPNKSRSCRHQGYKLRLPISIPRCTAVFTVQLSELAEQQTLTNTVITKNTIPRPNAAPPLALPQPAPSRGGAQRKQGVMTRRARCTSACACV